MPGNRLHQEDDLLLSLVQCYISLKLKGLRSL